MVAGGHGGRLPQDVRPVPVDQVHVHLAADQRARALRGRPRVQTRKGAALARKAGDRDGAPRPKKGEPGRGRLGRRWGRGVVTSASVTAAVALTTTARIAFAVGGWASTVPAPATLTAPITLARVPTATAAPTGPGAFARVPTTSTCLSTTSAAAIGAFRGIEGLSCHVLYRCLSGLFSKNRRPGGR